MLSIGVRIQANLKTMCIRLHDVRNGNLIETLIITNTIKYGSKSLQVTANVASPHK